MSKQKVYIYRNLTKGCLSVKFGGKVVRHILDDERPMMFMAKFQVNPGGRAQVLSRKRKFVHAFVVADSPWHPYEYSEDAWSAFRLREVKYNPYKAEHFYFADNPSERVFSSLVVIKEGKVYVLEAL